LTGHVDLESSCDVRRGPAASHSALARAPYRKPSPIGPDTSQPVLSPISQTRAEPQQEVGGGSFEPDSDSKGLARRAVPACKDGQIPQVSIKTGRP
jgi:hypothetical protein